MGLGVVRKAGRDCGVLLNASSVTRDKANRPVTPQDTVRQRSLGRKWCLKQQLGGGTLFRRERAVLRDGKKALKSTWKDKGSFCAKEAGLPAGPRGSPGIPSHKDVAP